MFLLVLLLSIVEWTTVLGDDPSDFQQQQQTYHCDESKCRKLNLESTIGYWWLPPIDLKEQPLAGGYTCWSSIGEDDFSSYPCDDGYYGHPVPNVTKPIQDQAEEDYGVEYQWYTCCNFEQQPQELYEHYGHDPNGAAIVNNNTLTIAEPSATTTIKQSLAEEEEIKNFEIQQTCTDMNCGIAGSSCWAAPDGLSPRVCATVIDAAEEEQQQDFIYPRDTGAYVEIDHGDKHYNVTQFICCTVPTEERDNDDHDVDGDLLSDHCSIESCTSLNGVGGGDCFADGITEPFTCDKSSKFPYPSRNGHDDLNMFNFHYVCCDTPNYYVDVLDEEDEWDGLHQALAITSTLSLITFFISGIFTLAILTNREARSKGWNVYLIMLSIPDILYNATRFSYGLIIITRSNTIIQTTWFIDWFYAVSNLSLNCVIVYQVHKFLRLIRAGSVRIPPPTVKQVLINSVLCYSVALGCGLWMLYLHVVGNDIAGGSHDKFLRFHRISLICMVIPPIVFVTLIGFDVWYRQLLPPGGRSRILAIYFLRVIFVFTVTWLPYMILITFGLRSSRVLGYIGLCFASIQGTISVVVAISKNDIRCACEDFLRCQCNHQDSPRRTSISGEDGASPRDGGGKSPSPPDSKVNGTRNRRKSKYKGDVVISGISAELVASAEFAARSTTATASCMEKSDRGLTIAGTEQQHDQFEPGSEQSQHPDPLQDLVANEEKEGRQHQEHKLPSNCSFESDVEEESEVDDQGQCLVDEEC